MDSLRPASLLTHGVSSILADRDPQTLEALGAVELISNYAFAEDANRKIIQLIQDPQLMVNGTGSFLSGDRAEVLSPIIGEENAGGLSSSNLEGMVRSTIEELEQNPAQKSWGTITAITKDLPIYPSLRERLKTLLAGLDIESLWKTDAIATYHALRVAASQAPYYEDEDLRNRFEEGLLLVAQSLSERYQGNVSTGETDESGISMERHANELLDISLALSARLNDPRATTKAWSQLLQNLLIRWPQIGEHIASTFSRLVYELPLRQLHGMWPVLLSLRSSRASSL